MGFRVSFRVFLEGSLLQGYLYGTYVGLRLRFGVSGFLLGVDDTRDPYYRGTYKGSI